MRHPAQPRFKALILGAAVAATFVTAWQVVPVTAQTLAQLTGIGTADERMVLMDLDPDSLQDQIGPCENNSPVGPKFTQPLPIPPAKAGARHPAACDLARRHG